MSHQRKVHYVVNSHSNCNQNYSFQIGNVGHDDIITNVHVHGTKIHL